MHQAALTSSASPIAKPNPALERLQTGVRELLDSQAGQEVLKFKARFYHYSFNNVLLIYLQRPDASLVAGYKRWQELGRQVRKGEASIAILAPIVQRAKAEGEREAQVVGFRPMASRSPRHPSRCCLPTTVRPSERHLHEQRLSL